MELEWNAVESEAVFEELVDVNSTRKKEIIRKLHAIVNGTSTDAEYTALEKLVPFIEQTLSTAREQPPCTGSFELIQSNQNILNMTPSQNCPNVILPQSTVVHHNDCNVHSLFTNCYCTTTYEVKYSLPYRDAQ